MVTIFNINAYVIWYCGPCQYFCQQILKKHTLLSQNVGKFKGFTATLNSCKFVTKNTMFQLFSNIVRNIFSCPEQLKLTLSGLYYLTFREWPQRVETFEIFDLMEKHDMTYILTILNFFDNFKFTTILKFWQFLTIMNFFDNFTFFDNFYLFWQFW